MRPMDETMFLEHGATRHMRLAHGMVLLTHAGGLVARHMRLGDGLCAPSMMSCRKCRNFVTFLPKFR